MRPALPFSLHGSYQIFVRQWLARHEAYNSLINYKVGTCEDLSKMLDLGSWPFCAHSVSATDWAHCTVLLPCLLCDVGVGVRWLSVSRWSLSVRETAPRVTRASTFRAMCSQHTGVSYAGSGQSEPASRSLVTTPLWFRDADRGPRPIVSLR